MKGLDAGSFVVTGKGKTPLPPAGSGADNVLISSIDKVISPGGNVVELVTIDGTQIAIATSGIAGNGAAAATTAGSSSGSVAGSQSRGASTADSVVGAGSMSGPGSGSEDALDESSLVSAVSMHSQASQAKVH